jgi:hypothetical protein
MNKSEFAEELKNRMAKEFAGKKVITREVSKVNTKSLKLIVTNATENEPQVGPSVDLDELYTEYTRRRELDSIAEELSDIIKHAFSVIPSDFGVEIENAENAKDNIFFTLVNTAKNTELLANVPHREIEDLSVVYRRIVRNDDVGFFASIVTNDLAEIIGKSEEELWKLALANTKKLLPARVCKVEDLIREKLEEVFPSDVVNEMIPAKSDNTNVWIITNTVHLWAAANILYKDILNELAEKFNSDLYLLPSSIHNCMVVSAEIVSPDGLNQVVIKANEEDVVDEEILSDHVYFYSRNEHAIKSI